MQKIKRKQETIIDGTSLYRKTETVEYLGEFNIQKYKETLSDNNELLTEIQALGNSYTKVFMTSNEDLITATRIEGIKFLAGAQPVDNQPDFYKPVLGTRRSEAVGFPLYEFVTTPPDGRNMYVYIHWRRGSISQMYIGISARYANKENYVVHRAPIPNCAFPDGHMCLGNLKNQSEFSAKAITKLVKDLMTSGWNSDWHKNQVFFCEKDANTMQIRWHKPMTQITECVQLNNKNILAITNRIEKETNQFLKIKTVPLFRDEENQQAINADRNRQNTDNITIRNDQTETAPTETNPAVGEARTTPNQIDQPNNQEAQEIPTTPRIEPEIPTTPRIIDLRQPEQVS